MGLKRLEYTQEIATKHKMVGWGGGRRKAQEGGDYMYIYFWGFTLLYWRREWQTSSAFCLENLINSMKRQKNITPKDAPSMSVGVQNVTGEEQRK